MKYDGYPRDKFEFSPNEKPFSITGSERTSKLDKIFQDKNVSEIKKIDFIDEDSNSQSSTIINLNNELGLSSVNQFTNRNLERQISEIANGRNPNHISDRRARFNSPKTRQPNYPNDDDIKLQTLPRHSRGRQQSPDQSIVRSNLFESMQPSQPPRRLLPERNPKVIELNLEEQKALFTFRSTVERTSQQYAEHHMRMSQTYQLDEIKAHLNDLTPKIKKEQELHRNLANFLRFQKIVEDQNQKKTGQMTVDSIQERLQWLEEQVSLMIQCREKKSFDIGNEEDEIHGESQRDIKADKGEYLKKSKSKSKSKSKGKQKQTNLVSKFKYLFSWLRKPQTDKEPQPEPQVLRKPTRSPQLRLSLKQRLKMILIQPQDQSNQQLLESKSVALPGKQTLGALVKQQRRKAMLANIEGYFQGRKQLHSLMLQIQAIDHLNIAPFDKKHIGHSSNPNPTKTQKQLHHIQKLRKLLPQSFTPLNIITTPMYVLPYQLSLPPRKLFQIGIIPFFYETHWPIPSRQIPHKSTSTINRSTLLTCSVQGVIRGTFDRNNQENSGTMRVLESLQRSDNENRTLRDTERVQTKITKSFCIVKDDENNKKSDGESKMKYTQTIREPMPHPNYRSQFLNQRKKTSGRSDKAIQQVQETVNQDELKYQLHLQAFYLHAPQSEESQLDIYEFHFTGIEQKMKKYEKKQIEKLEDQRLEKNKRKKNMVMEVQRMQRMKIMERVEQESKEQSEDVTSKCKSKQAESKPQLIVSNRIDQLSRMDRQIQQHVEVWFDDSSENQLIANVPYQFNRINFPYLNGQQSAQHSQSISNPIMDMSAISQVQPSPEDQQREIRRHLKLGEFRQDLPKSNQQPFSPKNSVLKIPKKTLDFFDLRADEKKKDSQKKEKKINPNEEHFVNDGKIPVLADRDKDGGSCPNVPQQKRKEPKLPFSQPLPEGKVQNVAESQQQPQQGQNPQSEQQPIQEPQRNTQPQQQPLVPPQPFPPQPGNIFQRNRHKPNPNLFGQASQGSIQQNQSQKNMTTLPPREIFNPNYQASQQYRNQQQPAQWIPQSASFQNPLNQNRSFSNFVSQPIANNFMAQVQNFVSPPQSTNTFDTFGPQQFSNLQNQSQNQPPEYMSFGPGMFSGNNNPLNIMQQNINMLGGGNNPYQQQNNSYQQQNSQVSSQHQQNQRNRHLMAPRR